MEQVDVNVLCGTIKDFLRSLNEPLIPRAVWDQFTFAVEMTEDNRAQRIVESIAELPEPNRDTLAFLMIHLQKYLIPLSLNCVY